ncbi:hypothetical protein Q31b_19720 [Novipirellula aureliae]|uniref:Uncharacterized protein n=1 Tax=Novipirellula aureliae TaxID=2527966 RepID=A0A5C6E6W7_9BACT|nr:hypothetical protein [Novipirellula aureliae]TWU42939.1 hypothetical protein Q31b_19720 [Novipirellula aureliae]
MGKRRVRPICLMAPMTNGVGDAILIGRSDVAFEVGSLLAIGRASDGRQWLVRVGGDDVTNALRDLVIDVDPPGVPKPVHVYDGPVGSMLCIDSVEGYRVD